MKRFKIEDNRWDAKPDLYVTLFHPPYDTENILHLSEKSANEQIKRLKTFKQNRNIDAVKKSLANLNEASNGDSNLMPYIINAIESSATLGEISDILRESFGIHS